MLAASDHPFSDLRVDPQSWFQALTAECEAEAASLRPPEGDAALRRAIVERLEAHAQTVAPGSRLRVFGSSSCGLNAAGADPDMKSRLI